MSSRNKKVQIVARKPPRKPISPTSSSVATRLDADLPTMPRAAKLPPRGVHSTAPPPPSIQPNEKQPELNELNEQNEQQEDELDDQDDSILGKTQKQIDAEQAVLAANAAHDIVLASNEDDDIAPLVQQMPIIDDIIFEPIEITKQLIIYFRDTEQEMIDAWTAAFTADTRLFALAASRGYDLQINIQKGSILEIGTPVDAFVSACSSFGLKKNGVDALYVKEYGLSLEKDVADSIIKKHKGLLTVGRAMMIPLPTAGDATPKARYLINSPVSIMASTDISETINSYCCFKGMLEIVNTFNEAKKGRIITSIACPGLGTGLGSMPYFRCALQMRAALDSFFGQGFCTRDNTSIRDHYMLLIRTSKIFTMNPLYKI